MSGIAAVRKDFESMPKRGFVDLTKDSDPPEFSESQMSLRDSTSLSQLLQLSQSNWRRMDLEGAVTGAQENKRELDVVARKEAESNSLKPTNLQLQALMKQRQRKESTAKDFQGKDAGRLQRAIQKEIRKNMETGA